MKSSKNNILENKVSEYEKEIVDLKNKIFELNKENDNLKKENNRFKEKTEYISRASVRVEENIDNLKKKSNAKYILEIQKLASFSKKWKEYFDYLKDKYPKYEMTANAIKLKDELDILLGKKDPETIKKLDGVLNKSHIAGKKFNPKEMIANYVSSTSDNGFNLDEVLNPGELHLEDICKELGLIDEK